jgi:ferrochelatase
MKKKGLLLINLGTPSAPEVESVKAYLKEFLMDSKVIDLPFLLRFFLVNFLIVPKRVKTSTHNYLKIWTKKGSPLLYNLEDLASEVRKKLDSSKIVVKIAMRYGGPKILDALKNFKEEGVQEIVVLPLYPQYAEATTGSTIAYTKECAKKITGLNLSFIRLFYSNPDFIDAYADLILRYLKNEPDSFLIFSFHGLPVRQLKKICQMQRIEEDKNYQCCEINLNLEHISLLGPTQASLQEQQAKSIETSSLCEQNCYRFQCIKTANFLASKLNLNSNQYCVAFQSRLGRGKWITPYLDEVLVELPKKGIKKVMVCAPSFVADCIETLEEIGIQSKELFLKSGGEKFILVPALNAESKWAESIIKISKINS